MPLNPALTPNINSTENPENIRILYVHYIYYTKIRITVFNKQHVATRNWNTYILSTTCRPKNGVCWGREPKKEENQEIEIHKNIYYSSILQTQAGWPSNNAGAYHQTARRHITDGSNIHNHRPKNIKTDKSRSRLTIHH